MWVKTLLVSLALIGGPASQAWAEGPDALEISVVYTGDATGVIAGAQPHAGRYLDNLDLIADLDLDSLVGWKGATLHAYGLNNSGGAPNDVAATLQGVDNIEVARQRFRLFELWLDQAIGDGISVRAGLYNINSEFYVSDSAALLIAPAFGIGSELAATGPNGPSIFPSTALGGRVNVELGERGYARGAVLNAKSGVLGDPGGVDWTFGDGALTIAEAGITGDSRLSAGVWRYTRRQEDIRNGSLHHAHGGYVLAEQKVYGADDGPAASVFVRAGFSDGDTSPFKGGWQAGLLVTRPLGSRPESALSVGLQQGALSTKFRSNLRDEGINPARAESGVEVTYSDKVLPRVTIQPDLQWIRNSGGDQSARGKWIAALRVKVDLSPRP